jgi:hypothetical protein
MSRVEEIEAAIDGLPPERLLSRWIELFEKYTNHFQMPIPSTTFQPSSGFAAAKNSGRKIRLIREASHAEQLKDYLAEIRFAAAFQYLGFDVEVEPLRIKRESSGVMQPMAIQAENVTRMLATFYSLPDRA